MDWIGLAQDRDRCRTLVSAVMNLRVPWNAGNILTSCKPVSFSRRTLHHGVSKRSRAGCLERRCRNLENGRTTSVPVFLKSVRRPNWFMFSLKCPDLLWGSTSLLFSLCRASFPGVKQGCDVDHVLPALPYSAVGTSEWSCTCAPLMCLHGVDWDCYTRWL